MARASISGYRFKGRQSIRASCCDSRASVAAKRPSRHQGATTADLSTNSVEPTSGRRRIRSHQNFARSSAALRRERNVIVPPLKLSPARRNPHKTRHFGKIILFPNEPSISRRSCGFHVEPAFDHRYAFRELRKFCGRSIAKNAFVATNAFKKDSARKNGYATSCDVESPQHKIFGEAKRWICYYPIGRVRLVRMGEKVAHLPIAVMVGVCTMNVSEVFFQDFGHMSRTTCGLKADQRGKLMLLKDMFD